MEAGKRTITDILTGNRLLQIPFYQRAYVWGEPQWERFLDDMMFISQSQSNNYFLGSIILKQQNTSTSSIFGDVRTVIDGQQRLTTITIFIKVLSLIIDDDYSFSRYFRLKGNLPAIEHNHNDIETFNQIIDLASLEDLEFPEENRIGQAYIYFKREIDPSKLNIDLLLANIMLVGIDLQPDDDEQQIFDTINSLGVRLTTAELLKNYFFDRNSLELYSNYWKNVFESSEEVKNYWDKEVTAGRQKRTNVDVFFAALLQIKMHDPILNVTTADKLFFSKVENLFQSYKMFIGKYNIDRTDFIKEINEYAKIYYDNFQCDAVDSEVSSEFGIERLNVIIYGLETTTLIPYVLFVLKNQPNFDERNRIFAYVESFILRRIVCRLTAKNYNQFFGDRLIINRIITKSGLQNLVQSQDEKINYFPTDLEVKQAFKNSKLTNKQAAGILYLLESRVRNRSHHSTTLLGLSHYSLEHVMPKKWRNNWNDSLTEEEMINRDLVLLTLGNLTIITSTLNSSIRDSDWVTKKEGRNGHLGLRAYAAGIQLFSNYLNKAKWDEDVIDERADFLSNEAIRIWVE